MFERNADTGTGIISVVLNRKLLRFNGGLFAELLRPAHQRPAARPPQRRRPPELGQRRTRHLRHAARTRLEPAERHQLGAHFTPRAYVERLVLPTVIEPLRAEWENVRAAAITHARAGDLKKARAEVNAFHDRLCQVNVLDPACGCGNFLYVSLNI